MRCSTAHFHIGGRKVAIGAEPDLLFDLSAACCTRWAPKITAAVTTTDSPVLERMPTEEVLIGDLEDLENLAQARGCDLLITHSHGRQAAERLKIPFFRAGLADVRPARAPDTSCRVGYRGTRDLIFEIGNLFIETTSDNHEPTPDTLADRRRQIAP